MARFDNLIKSAELEQGIKKSFELNSQFAELLKAQESVKKSLSGYSIVTELAKSMQQSQKMMVNLTLAAIEAMTRVSALQPKFVIPQSTLDAIASLNRQHEQLFLGIKELSEALKLKSSAFAQINNLNFALSGISGQIAAAAIQQRNWTIIEDFEEATEQVIEFSESLKQEVAEHNRQFEILLALLIAFFHKHKMKGLFVIALLDLLLNLHAAYTILTPKPEPAAKEDVKQLDMRLDSLTQYIQVLNEQLKQAKEYRITNRECKVKLKPNSKTLTICKLPDGIELYVLQVNHEWVLVSFIDPKDNLPQTGWILKNFLDKPE
jgi:hypothetical protein